jgi:hypothetical protein
VGEHAAAHDEVRRRVQLEEEQLSRRDRLEGPPTRSPKVHLFQTDDVTDSIEPVAVGDTDIDAQCHLHASGMQLLG